jgi:hypothetical protein
MPKSSDFELEMDIEKLKICKSPSIYHIQLEGMKALEKKYIPKIYKHINSIWKKEQFSVEWEDSMIVIVNRKGN